MIFKLQILGSEFNFFLFSNDRGLYCYCFCSLFSRLHAKQKSCYPIRFYKQVINTYRYNKRHHYCKKIFWKNSIISLNKKTADETSTVFFYYLDLRMPISLNFALALRASGFPLWTSGPLALFQLMAHGDHSLKFDSSSTHCLHKSTGGWTLPGLNVIRVCHFP